MTFEDKCRKRKFRDRIAAELFIVNPRRGSSSEEVRVYRCPHCRAWHTTSRR